MASPNSSGPPPPAPSKIQVKTTAPIVPLHTERSPIRTERLIIRPLDASDAEEVHVMRTQPEVMHWTAIGTVDKDVDQSRVWLERFLPPKDLKSFNFALMDRGEAAGGDTAGVLVGTAGVHTTHNDFGWPEVGYMLRKEYWGKGIATEFMRAFIKAWWALPRKEVQIKVDAATVEGRGAKDSDDELRVPEILFAMIEAGNAGSRRVLEKAGFKKFKEWTEPDSRATCEGRTATLIAFLLERTPDS